MNFFDRMIEKFEVVGRARTLSVLRQQSDRTLQDAGFSPELVRIGIKAWPWRAEDELTADSLANQAKIPFAGTAAVANVGQIDVVNTGKAANNPLETAA